jgi:hypothetical protein
VTGKLDRRALPAPEYGSGAAARPPRSALERHVAEVWSGVLGVAEVGVDDDFFELGGTSLLLYRVYARLREMRAGLRVVDLFRYCRLEDLAAFLGDEGPEVGGSRPEAQTAAGREGRLRATA